MKKVLLIVLLFLMNGCLYWGNGCWRPIVEVVSARCTGKVEGTEFPAIAFFQKLDTIGKTDVQQRWKDAVDCGAEYGDVDLKLEKQLDLYKYDRFDNCMIKKGYEKFWFAKCGYQEAELNKGVCNL